MLAKKAIVLQFIGTNNVFRGAERRRNNLKLLFWIDGTQRRPKDKDEQDSANYHKQAYHWPTTGWIDMRRSAEATKLIISVFAWTKGMKTKRRRHLLNILPVSCPCRGIDVVVVVRMIVRQRPKCLASRLELTPLLVLFHPLALLNTYRL